jgi:hypothetical protein
MLLDLPIGIGKSAVLSSLQDKISILREKTLEISGKENLEDEQIDEEVATFLLREGVTVGDEFIRLKGKICMSPSSFVVL